MKNNKMPSPSMGAGSLRFVLLVGIWLAISSLAGCSILPDRFSPGHSADIQAIGGCQETASSTKAGEDGIGGTGIRDLSSDQPVGGIGGTGIQTTNHDVEKMPVPGGIGGTGISGMVTAFGSICVNGFKIDYQPEQVEGDVPLAIGQVVNVVADVSERGWVARRVAQEILVSGPITELNPRGKVLRVMGQQIGVDGAAPIVDEQGNSIKLSELAPGKNVYVSGFRRSDGHILATFIGLYLDPRPDAIVGLATMNSKGEMLIGGQSMRYQASSELDLPAKVRVTGRWTQGELIVKTMQPVQAFGRESLKALSVQGFFKSDNGAAITLEDGTKIIADTSQAGNLKAYFDKPVIIDAVGSPDKGYRLSSIYLWGADTGEGNGADRNREGHHDGGEEDDHEDGGESDGEDGGESDGEDGGDGDGENDGEDND